MPSNYASLDFLAKRKYRKARNRLRRRAYKLKYDSDYRLWRQYHGKAPSQ